MISSLVKIRLNRGRGLANFALKQFLWFCVWTADLLAFYLVAVTSCSSCTLVFTMLFRKTFQLSQKHWNHIGSNRPSACMRVYQIDVCKRLFAYLWPTYRVISNDRRLQSRTHTNTRTHARADNRAHNDTRGSIEVYLVFHKLMKRYGAILEIQETRLHSISALS